MKTSIITTSIITLLASASFAEEYTESKYSKYMDTANSTFTSASSISFDVGWKSSADTLTTGGSLYLQGKGYTYDITGANFSISSTTPKSLISLIASLMKKSVLTLSYSST